jgi:tetratricopeptide (TPR) repeat protein
MSPAAADAAAVLALVADGRTDDAVDRAQALMAAREAEGGPLAIREVTALLTLADRVADARPQEAIALCRFVVGHAALEAHAAAAARRIEAMSDAGRHEDLQAGIAELASVGDAIAAAKRHGRRGEPDLAIAAALRGVALLDSRRTCNQLAATYRQSGRVGDAERTWRASLERWPATGNAPAALGLATILADRGEPAQALALADAAIAADPGAANVAAHALRGRVLLQLSRGPEAEAALTVALQGRSADARRRLEELRDGYEDEGDHRSAQRLDALLEP